MASIHPLDNETPKINNQSTNIGYDDSKVPSVFHSIESLMTSYSYPIDPWNSMPQNSDGRYCGLPPTDNVYPSSLLHQTPSIPSENRSSQPPLFPSFETFSGTSGDSLGNHFPQQHCVSDISVNPFQDHSELSFDKKPACKQVSLDFSPVNIPASSGNDEVLDVDSFSPFGSPTYCNEQNQTNPGPSSISSAGYTSGYQSCEGSTENSPLGPLNGCHPLYDIHLRQLEKSQSDFYPQEQTTLKTCAASALSPVLPATGTSDLSSGPSGTISNPDSVQSIDLPDLSTTTAKFSVPAVPIATESDKLHTSNSIDKTQVKKSRVKYTPVQLEILEKSFIDTPYPDWDEMEELSKKLDVAEQKIKVWFQNKRARWRKKQTAQESQDVSAFKPLPQMSALYRFPCSVPDLIRPKQKPTGMFPSSSSSNVMSQPFSGQHYNQQPTLRPSFSGTQVMSVQTPTNNFGFPTRQSLVRSRAMERPSSLPTMYHSPMTQTGAPVFCSGPQANYENFVHMSNNYMYPNPNM